jgi:hypothetical protein
MDFSVHFFVYRAQTDANLHPPSVNNTETFENLIFSSLEFIAYTAPEASEIMDRVHEIGHSRKCSIIYVLSMKSRERRDPLAGEPAHLPSPIFKVCRTIYKSCSFFQEIDTAARLQRSRSELLRSDRRAKGSDRHRFDDRLSRP